MLDWSRERLADASIVGLRTVIDFARGARGPRRVTLAALRAAFEKAGVELIAENGRGPGVRLREPSKKKSK